MELQTELIIKGILCLLAVPVVLRFSHAPKRFSSRKAGQLLVLAGLVALTAYVNFGFFHGRTTVHYWEQFHYFLGSKYFPELGYDGLYAASIAAQIESAPNGALQPVIRDLRTNEVSTIAATAAHRAEVRNRFSDERWEGFLRDHRHFLENMGADYLYQVRKDHGYNPTPAWTFVARTVTSWLPASRKGLVGLGLIDPLLMLLALGMVSKTYGSRTAAMMAVVLGLGYPWRYHWIGGALLRLDWMAALVVAVCLLKAERYRPAGAFLAYAALMRLFPLGFLFGPFVLFVRALWRKEELGWVWKLAQGFVLAIIVGLSAGALTGRGPAAWSEFAGAIELHRGTWLTNNVGFANVLLYGPETMKRELVDWNLPEPWIHWQVKMDGLKHQRRIPNALAVLLLLSLIAVAAWEASLDEAVVLGIGALFAVFLLTCYYWILLILVPLRGGRRSTAAALVFSAVFYGLNLVTGSFEMIFGMMSWALLILLLVWIAPDLRRAYASWRESPDPQ